MEKINCTWPFSSHKNHICVNQNDAKMAHDFGMAHHRRKPITCLDPCHYLQVNSYETGSFASQSPQISFKFPENMRITRAYYSYQRINLIAEIGGYVGLFLGVSVIQITNVLDHASRWISSKVEFVAALSTSRITHWIQQMHRIWSWRKSTVRFEMYLIVSTRLLHMNSEYTWHVVLYLNLKIL